MYLPMYMAEESKIYPLGANVKMLMEVRLSLR